MKEFKGVSGFGYYFSITDKEPKPDEYKYMTQGVYQLGELLVTFSAFWNDGAENISEETLKIIKSALHVKK